MRNQRVKLGDFGVSILTKKGVEKYKLCGFSIDWCMQAIKDKYEACNRLKDDESKKRFYETEWTDK